MKRVCTVPLLVGGAWATAAQDLVLPNRHDSLKFAAIGDNGTGEPPEYDVGRQMAAYHTTFPFETVIMLGDNLYGRQEPQDFVKDWKICCFHHPPYSDGKTHGSQVDLRVVLEPLFVRDGVNVVFSGHDDVYERLKPQKGVTYFVSGAGGRLRKGDVRRSNLTAAQFDQDCSFMLVEVSGDELFFQAVSRTAATVDAGVVHRQPRS